MYRYYDDYEADIIEAKRVIDKNKKKIKVCEENLKTCDREDAFIYEDEIQHCNYEISEAEEDVRWYYSLTRDDRDLVFNFTASLIEDISKAISKIDIDEWREKCPHSEENVKKLKEIGELGKYLYESYEYYTKSTKLLEERERELQAERTKK